MRPQMNVIYYTRESLKRDMLKKPGKYAWLFDWMTK
jgi:hypothetical protein